MRVMKRFSLFSKTDDYWHFHPIGTGLVFTYHTKTMIVSITHELTGCFVDTIDMSQVGGYESYDHFKEDSHEQFKFFIDANVNVNHDLMDNPTIVKDVAIDFTLLKN